MSSRNLRASDRGQSYIVTDKSIYKNGEEVWFRVFLLHAVSQKKSVESKALFVDIINENDSVITKLLLNAGQQQLTGRITLPDSLPTGCYWMRAYTRQMTASDTAGIFIQPIYVINSRLPDKDFLNEANALPKTAAIKDKPDVVFLPEGGALITGANSTVVFRIIDKNGSPVAAAGYVKDNHDSVTARFASGKNGMGKFDFYPIRYRKYIPELTWNGTDTVYAFPSFDFHAAQLAVLKKADGTGKIRVLLEDSLYRKDFTTYILGVSKDSLCFAATGTGNYESDIAEDKFPMGVATFFLFDDCLKLLSERSLYIKNANLIVKANTDRKTYDKRDLVHLDIAVTDLSNHPVSASLAISISDSILATNQNNMNPDLTAINTGSGDAINNWNLIHTGPLSNDELDLYMLVKKANHKNSLKKPVPSINHIIEDSLLYLKGTVIDSKHIPIPGKIVMLFAEGGAVLYDMDTTDINGRFCFRLSEYADSTKFAVQVTSLQGKVEALNVIVDPVSFPVFNTPLQIKKIKINFQQPDISNHLMLYNDSTFIGSGKEWLNTVTVKINRKKAVTYDVSKRASPFSKIITSDKLKKGGYGSVSNAILGVAGLHILNGYLVAGGPPNASGIGASSEPLLVINGVQISSVSPEMSGMNDPGTVSPLLGYVNSINVRDIDFIEVLTGPEAAIYGLRGGNGVIIINTTTAINTDGKTEGNRLQTFYARGYHAAPVFTEPDYTQREIKKAKHPDLRSTLYWNGNITTDASGKASIRFFTSDVATSYTVNINGISAQGDVIHSTLTFNVK